MGCSSPVALLEIQAGVTSLELPLQSCWRGVWVLSGALFCHWSLPWPWDRRVHPPAFQEAKITTRAATDSIIPGISESRKPQLLEGFPCLPLLLLSSFLFILDLWQLNQSSQKRDVYASRGLGNTSRPACCVKDATQFGFNVIILSWASCRVPSDKVSLSCCAVICLLLGFE